VVRRGFDLVGQGCAAASDLGDDLLRGGVPDERFGVVVPVFGPEIDRVLERGDAVERAASEAPVGELREPAFESVLTRLQDGSTHDRCLREWTATGQSAHRRLTTPMPRGLTEANVRLNTTAAALATVLVFRGITFVFPAGLGFFTLRWLRAQGYA
jgi:hypothetical protein